MDEVPNEQSGQAGGPEKGAFSQADIDALMQGGADAADPAANAAPAEDAAPPAESGSVSQADTDALLDAAEGAGADEGAEGAASQDSGSSQAETRPDTRVDTLGRPFDEAAAAMESAGAEERTAAQNASPSPHAGE